MTGMVEALASLEEEDKIKRKRRFGKYFWEKQAALRQSHKIRFVISRRNFLTKYRRTSGFLVAVIAMPLAVALIILALVTDAKSGFTERWRGVPHK